MNLSRGNHIQARTLECEFARCEPKIKNVGIDEKRFLTDHKYASFMVDINGEKILDIVERRTLKIHTPQGYIVHEKFHILKYLNKAVDKLQRTEHKVFMNEDDETLTEITYVFLKRPKNMTDTEKALTSLRHLITNTVMKGRQFEDSIDQNQCTRILKLRKLPDR